MAIEVQYKTQQQKHSPSGFDKLEVTDATKVQPVWTANRFGEILNLAGEGDQHEFSWASVVGASKVEINTASLRLGPASIETAEPFSISKQSTRIDINVGQGKAIRTLTFDGLQAGASATALHSRNDVSNAGLKLLVSVADANGAFTPIYSVPEVSARGVFPRSFVGASFNQDTLSLSTPLQATTIRLQLVDNDFPAATSTQSIAVSSVRGTYLSLPIDINARLDDSTPLFEFPGVMPLQSPEVQVPLTQPLSNALQTKLDTGVALQTSIILQATPSTGVNAMVQVLVTNPSGYLLRTESGVYTTQLTGEPTPLTFPLPEPLADEQASRVEADLSITYDGIRILSDLSASLPAHNGDIRGQIVGSTATTKVLPPQSLFDQLLARIGVIGRAPEATELVMELIDMTGGIPGSVIAKPEVLHLESETKLATHWFSFSQQAPFNLPLAVRLRANRGRFFWVGENDPLTRIAIYDADPGSETINLNGQALLTGQALPFNARSYALPAAHFRQHLPVIDSSLFLTIDIADLHLRYAR